MATFRGSIAMRPRLTRIRGLLNAFTEALESEDFSAEFERLLTHHRRGS
jgi:hypothetical protein